MLKLLSSPDSNFSKMTEKGANVLRIYVKTCILKSYTEIQRLVLVLRSYMPGFYLNGRYKMILILKTSN